jgi:hypothetical protein
MFSTTHCPHTGIVNVFSDAEPFLAIGSVHKTGMPARYQWWLHLGDDPQSGIAPDFAAAERRLLHQYRNALMSRNQTDAAA